MNRRAEWKAALRMAAAIAIGLGLATLPFLHYGLEALHAAIHAADVLPHGATHGADVDQHTATHVASARR